MTGYAVAEIWEKLKKTNKTNLLINVYLGSDHNIWGGIGWMMLRRGYDTLRVADGRVMLISDK